MTQVIETFFNSFLGKFVEQVDPIVVFCLVAVCWIANNLLKAASENDKLWARWITERRRQWGIPFAPYVFSVVYYVLLVGPDPLTARTAGAAAGNAVLQATVAVAAYEFYRRTLHKWVPRILKAILKKWGVDV